jgi:hypothetical protein
MLSLEGKTFGFFEEAGSLPFSAQFENVYRLSKFVNIILYAFFDIYPGIII